MPISINDIISYTVNQYCTLGQQSTSSDVYKATDNLPFILAKWITSTIRVPSTLKPKYTKLALLSNTHTAQAKGSLSFAHPDKLTGNLKSMC